MNNITKRLFIISLLLTLCATGAQSQTAFKTDSELGGVELRHDTLHVTPAMIDSLKRIEQIEEFEREVESVVFVPKGHGVTGLSVFSSQSNQNKYQILILEGV